jgi:serine beta-lactamase-like protein LACTB, mitochondrial
VRRVNQMAVAVIASFCCSLSLSSQPARNAASHDTACVSTTFVQPPAAYAAAVARARTLACTRFLPDLPGLQIAVAVNGRLVWSAGFGYADRERGLPVARTTMFQIGSISKTLTGDAVALLVEAHKLDLDVPIQRYVPSFPEKRWPITARQLAGHQSGIRHYRRNGRAENYTTTHYPTVLSSLVMFAGDSLLFEPGTRFGYSTYGYTLLSAALENASGMNFLTFMDTRVFRPLGMLHTAPDQIDSVMIDRAQKYDRDETTFRIYPAPRVDNSYKWAGGGFLSSAEDLVRFANAHLAPGHLQSASLDLLFTAQRTHDGRPQGINRAGSGYGVGWVIGRDARGRRIVSNDGGAIGGTAELFVDRDTKVVIANCANVNTVPGRPLRVMAAMTTIFDP